MSLKTFLRRTCYSLPQTSWPLHPKKPVLFVWNAPTQDCETQERVKLSLDQFDIVSSPAQGVVGQVLTLFYKDRLGIYPYYEAEAEDAPVNGGLPQSVILSQHLEKMSKDLDTYIPDRKAKGLSVIDWREWRPLWVRNWAGKSVYKKKTRELVTKKYPTMSSGELTAAATEEFELAARKFLHETIRQGKNLRPNQLWGFYLFPDCYNYDYKGKMDSYTGLCPDYERNDQLNWLWNESTALFPSIYLDPELRSTDQGRLFVLSRVKEAMRLASVGDGLARPVYVYSRPTYNSEMTLLTEKDLVSTIGESVALGAAGVIFWGGSSYATSSGCSDLNNYFRGPMGRYLLNVTTAAKECSQKLCKFNGRCLRRAPDSAVFLHLSPSTHKIISQSGKLKVTGSPGQAELKAFRQHFKCQCYNGTKGESCELGGKGGKGGKGEKGQREQKSSATSVLGMWPLCFVLQLGLLSLFH
uniref:Hyaluronidase n=1 Tax=Poecilia mexicana TaxID=48701 RepID=A0A3B3XUH3_9TELE